jgi:hypothetical protein
MSERRIAGSCAASGVVGSEWPNGFDLAGTRKGERRWHHWRVASLPRSAGSSVSLSSGTE